jgi:hypothetical protein
VDDLLISGSIPDRIQNAGQTVKVITQANDVTVENSAGTGDYLVLS